METQHQTLQKPILTALLLLLLISFLHNFNCSVTPHLPKSTPGFSDLTLSSFSDKNKTWVLEKNPIFSFISTTRSFLGSFGIEGSKSFRRKLLSESKVDGVVSELWCVAKNNAEDNALQTALDWACGAGADCRPVQESGACFEPDNVRDHASYAFNDYALRKGMNQQTCDFGGTAALIGLNPSHGSCIFPSSLSVKNGSFSAGTTTVLGPGAADTSDGVAGRWPATADRLFVFLSVTMAALIFLPPTA